jgi:hypothetical protein
MRLYIDSGTESGGGNDGMTDTIRARDSLLSNGYAIGPDLQHFIDYGAGHEENAWAARFDRVLLFLLPARGNFIPGDCWAVR